MRSYDQNSDVNMYASAIGDMIRTLYHQKAYVQVIIKIHKRCPFQVVVNNVGHNTTNNKHSVEQCTSKADVEQFCQSITDRIVELYHHRFFGEMVVNINPIKLEDIVINASALSVEQLSQLPSYYK